MTKGLGQRSQIDSIPLDELVAKAYHFAETARLHTFTESYKPGNIMVLDFDSILSYHVHYLKRHHYAVIIAPETRQLGVNSCTMEGIKYCQAWIFQYDSHHAKWRVYAWNGNIGDKAFSKLARNLLNEGYSSEGGKLHFKRLPRVQTA
ncbi:unnamed protein product [marine sediment metagenome]|uniref:Uncharacterized protein n=1 Tax=marine sediment metagenome TaxID=412755 RepID=X1PTL5_9ZZZZ